ncbi:MAG: AraC family transcriptional regulator [Lachnospiraceae bacterium]|nr:AraC family transcriptional regulator [Lachnospiraceae bacterium]
MAKRIQSATSDRVIGTPSALAKQTFFYMQETGKLKSIRHHISKRENMDSFLIAYVYSGEGYFTVNGRRTKVSTGACFFIDCRESYAHESPDDSPWELLWIHFNGASSREYYEYFTSLSGNIFYPGNPEEIIHIFGQLLSVNKNKEEYYELVTSSLIVQLLTALITTAKSGEKPADSTSDKLTQVRRYLSDHYKEKVSLDDLSAAFFISKYHLCREFKKKYGESITDYIRNKRITQAKEQLRFSDLHIGEIAAECGVPDVNYFVKQFKIAEGMTPSDYRKKWLGISYS